MIVKKRFFPFVSGRTAFFMFLRPFAFMTVFFGDFGIFFGEKRIEIR